MYLPPSRCYPHLGVNQGTTEGPQGPDQHHFFSFFTSIPLFLHSFLVPQIACGHLHSLGQSLGTYTDPGHWELNGDPKRPTSCSHELSGTRVKSGCEGPVEELEDGKVENSWRGDGILGRNSEETESHCTEIASELSPQNPREALLGLVSCSLS